MRVGIASDYVTHDPRIDLVPRLRELGYDAVDHGPATSEHTDYVKQGVQLTREVVAACFGVGTAIYGSGIGISIAANEVKEVRTVYISETYSAMMNRCHNDANILCFGSRVMDPDIALAIYEAFLEASFEDGRHAG